MLNNAGTAHVGEFGGPEKIVEAKGEIIEGLSDSGVAVLNLDDQAFSHLAAARQGADDPLFCTAQPGRRRLRQ